MDHKEAIEEAGKYTIAMEHLKDLDLSPLTKLLIVNTLVSELAKDWNAGVKQRKHFDKKMSDFLKSLD